MRARRSMLALLGGVTASLLASPSGVQSADDVPGLTQREQAEFQERMRNATSDAEREQIRAEYRNRVRQRQDGSGCGSRGQNRRGGGGSGGGGQGGGRS